MADPSNWRVACSYLSHCGEQGMGMVNEFLLALPFRLSNIDEEPVSQAQTKSKSKKDKPAPLADLDDIVQFCLDLGLRDTARGICRARTLNLMVKSLLSNIL